jgi:hypothetical protein
MSYMTLKYGLLGSWLLCKMRAWDWHIFKSLLDPLGDEPRDEGSI